MQIISKKITRVLTFVGSGRVDKLGKLDKLTSRQVTCKKKKHVLMLPCLSRKQLVNSSTRLLVNSSV